MPSPKTLYYPSLTTILAGKGSLLNKMQGTNGNVAQIYACCTPLMFTYPGKKLLFMGCEFGQGTEWSFNQTLDWYVLDYPHHAGIQTLIKDLNQPVQIASCVIPL